VVFVAQLLGLSNEENESIIKTFAASLVTVTAGETYSFWHYPHVKTK
jgi:hypothetical protein